MQDSQAKSHVHITEYTDDLENVTRNLSPPQISASMKALDQGPRASAGNSTREIMQRRSQKKESAMTA